MSKFYSIILLTCLTSLSPAIAQISPEHEIAVLEMGENPEKAAEILSQADSLVERMDFLLFLHAFENPTAERDNQIQAFLTELYDAAKVELAKSQHDGLVTSFLAPDPPVYDRTDSSIIPTVRLASSAGIINTLPAFYAIPCAILVKRPNLIGSTTPMWGGNRDNFLPRSGCKWNRGGIKHFPELAINTFIRTTHLADGDFIGTHGGTLRYYHMSYQNLIKENMKLNPDSLLTQVEDVPYPYYWWSYLSLNNYERAVRIRKSFQEAVKQLSNYYSAHRGFSKMDAEIVARNGLFRLAFGSTCDIDKPEISLRIPTINQNLAEVESLLNKSDLINKLPDHPFKPCSQSSGKNPLIHVATMNARILERLLDWGKSNAIDADIQQIKDIEIDVEATNSFNKTALMTAAQINNYESVKMLLEHGANVNAKTDDGYENDSVYSPLKYDQRTPLMYAAANSSLNIIRLLLRNGADVSAKDSKGFKPIDYLLGNGPTEKNPNLFQHEIEEAVKLLSEINT